MFCFLQCVIFKLSMTCRLSAEAWFPLVWHISVPVSMGTWWSLRAAVLPVPGLCPLRPQPEPLAKWKRMQGSTVDSLGPGRDAEHLEIVWWSHYRGAGTALVCLGVTRMGSGVPWYRVSPGVVYLRSQHPQETEGHWTLVWEKISVSPSLDLTPCVDVLNCLSLQPGLANLPQIKLESLPLPRIRPTYQSHGAGKTTPRVQLDLSALFWWNKIPVSVFSALVLVAVVAKIVCNKGFLNKWQTQ